MPDEKRMRLRYAGTCRVCGAELQAGDGPSARWSGIQEALQTAQNDAAPARVQRTMRLFYGFAGGAVRLREPGHCPAPSGLRLTAPGPHHTISLIWRTDRPLAPPAQRFLDHVRERVSSPGNPWA